MAKRPTIASLQAEIKDLNERLEAQAKATADAKYEMRARNERINDLLGDIESRDSRITKYRSQRDRAIGKLQAFREMLQMPEPEQTDQYGNKRPGW